jgi:hypothetical protein
LFEYGVERRVAEKSGAARDRLFAYEYGLFQMSGEVYRRRVGWKAWRAPLQVRGKSVGLREGEELKSDEDKVSRTEAREEGEGGRVCFGTRMAGPEEAGERASIALERRGGSVWIGTRDDGFFETRAISGHDRTFDRR